MEVIKLEFGLFGRRAKLPKYISWICLWEGHNVKYWAASNQIDVTLVK